MVKISVLVAVYNAEKYLRECLDSLLNQTLREVEVICIDDASEDESLNILREYSATDKRIKIISLTENCGQAHARNEGLKISQGEYICFVDSDDWIATDALKSVCHVYEQYPSADSVLFDVINVYEDGRQTQYSMDPFDVLSGYDAFVDSLTWKIHGVYTVRRDIHLRYPYDDSCRAYSDDNTTRLHYLASREVRCCTGKYYYRQHNSSVTHNVDVRRFDYLLANESMKQQLHDLDVSDETLNLYENVRWLNLIGVYMFYYLHHRELTANEARAGLRLMRATWDNIEIRRLDRKYTRKFGYMPLRFSWRAFKLQLEIYFFLRGILGRNLEG